MGRWNRILRGVLQWAPIAVDLVEQTDKSGTQKAHQAAHIVADAIGLADLTQTDPGASAGVARGVKMINDGVVLIQNSVGSYAGIAAAKKAAAAAKRKAAREKKKS